MVGKFKFKATFKKRSGGTFVKKFKSLTSAKRAVSGWTAAGGKLVRRKKR
jgi:hypothetical protein